MSWGVGLMIATLSYCLLSNAIKASKRPWRSSQIRLSQLIKIEHENIDKESYKKACHSNYNSSESDRERSVVRNNLVQIMIYIETISISHYWYAKFLIPWWECTIWTVMGGCRPEEVLVGVGVQWAHPFAPAKWPQHFWLSLAVTPPLWTPSAPNAPKIRAQRTDMTSLSNSSVGDKLLEILNSHRLDLNKKQCVCSSALSH